VKVGWREQLASVHKLVEDNITYYFIENDGYFNRENVYGYDDDAERFAFFNRAILELLPLIETTLHTIHVNDWHTSLLPLLLTVDYNNHNYYQNIKTTLNIHNLEYQGWYDVTVLPDVLGISTTYYENGLTRMGDSVNFLKSGIETAHEISINDVIREQMTSPEMINCGITAVLQNKLSA
ncbi:MAG: glycogen/starch synthase, partial [Turicibacter sp.]